MTDELPFGDVVVNYEGKDWRIVGATCSRCDNFFFYVDLPEFAPKWCCYCGMGFRYYVDHEGVRRDQNGRPSLGVK